MKTIDMIKIFENKNCQESILTGVMFVTNQNFAQNKGELF